MIKQYQTFAWKARALSRNRPPMPCPIIFVGLLFVSLCFSAGHSYAQSCDNAASHNTDAQPTYSGLTGPLTIAFNNLFGEPGSIDNRQNGYDLETNLLNPTTAAEFTTPAVTWSGGVLDPVTQILNSISYSYRLSLNGSAAGDVYMVVASEGSLLNASVLRTIELRVKNNGEVVYSRTFDQLGQLVIELAGATSKRAYRIPVTGSFDELEIATVSGFGANVQALLGAAAPFLKLYDLRRLPKEPAAPLVTTVNGTVQTCAPASQQTVFNVSNAQPGLTYKWYETASAGTSIYTGPSYSPTASTSVGVSTYYVEAVAQDACPQPIRRVSSARTSATRTVVECNPNDYPDLRLLINMPDAGYVKPTSLSKQGQLKLYNVGGTGTVTTGAINIYIYPPNSKFSMVLGDSPNWNLTYSESGNYYTLSTNEAAIAYGVSGFQQINLIINAAADVAKGKYNAQFEIESGSGGEINNLNNTISVELVVSEKH